MPSLGVSLHVSHLDIAFIPLLILCSQGDTPSPSPILWGRAGQCSGGNICVEDRKRHVRRQDFACLCIDETKTWLCVFVVADMRRATTLSLHTSAHAEKRRELLCVAHLAHAAPRHSAFGGGRKKDLCWHVFIHRLSERHLDSLVRGGAGKLGERAFSLPYHPYHRRTGFCWLLRAYAACRSAQHAALRRCLHFHAAAACAWHASRHALPASPTLARLDRRYYCNLAAHMVF